MMRHLASAQYWDQPAGEDTRRLFLPFGGPICADGISNCPLDRVLTYKNLIYLLNLQFSSDKGIQTTEVTRVIFDPTAGAEGVVTPPPNDYLTSTNWLQEMCSNNMLNIITNGYILPFRTKPKLARFP